MLLRQFCDVIHLCVTPEIIGSAQNAEQTSQTVQLKTDAAGFYSDCVIDCPFSPAFIQSFNIHQENSV